MSTPYEAVAGFLKQWKPFAELPSATLASQLLALLAEPDPAARRIHLRSASDLYRLQERYRELDLYRDGRNEKAEQFERLLELSVADFARAIAAGEQREYLGLLQFCLEFGRHAVPPRHNLMRGFILKLLELEPGGIGLKYSLYPGGILYTSAGKSHDEMAEDLAKLGMGGIPVAGGTMTRTGGTEFLFDMASTAYKATNDPKAVQEPLLRWVRNTGGREDRLVVRPDTPRAGT